MRLFTETYRVSTGRSVGITPTRPSTRTSSLITSVQALVLAIVICGEARAVTNDPVGDRFSAGGWDISSLTTERTATGLLVVLELTETAQPPNPNGTGVSGFIDLDTDRDQNSGQQSAIEFMAGATHGARSSLGVEYQLVLSSWSGVDGSVDLVDQTTRQVAGRVPVTFSGNTLTATIAEGVITASELDALHLAAIVGDNETFSDAAPNQGYVTTAPAEDTDVALQNNRFTVRVHWTTATGDSGPGTLVTKSSDSALFWFFEENNWELLVKVIDACSLTNTFWVFSAATTNVAYTLTVTDTASGTTKIYENTLGVNAPAVNDTAAFSTCN